MGSEQDRAGFGAETDTIAETVGALRLGVWHETRKRLLPRLVPSARAGPVAIPVPGAFRDGNRSRLLVDVAIDVPGGLVRVDRSLLEAWSVPIDRVRDQARVNLARRPDPPVITVTWHPARPSLLGDGPWTGGWLLNPERLVGLAGLAGPRDTAVAAGFGPAGPEVLVVVPVGQPGVEPLVTAARTATTVARSLSAEARTATIVLAALGAAGSFPRGRSLE